MAKTKEQYAKEINESFVPRSNFKHSALYAKMRKEKISHAKRVSHG